MTKWEYYAFEADVLGEAVLNDQRVKTLTQLDDMGKKGWEVVTILPNPDPAPDKNQIVFARRKLDE